LKPDSLWHSVTAMNDIVFRRASVDDAALLAKMEKENFSDPWNEETLKRVLENAATHFIIAEIDGHAVAYGGMNIVFEDCDIINLAVDSDFRRCGIGKALVSQMLDVCRSVGVESVFLEHRESNISAAALYEKFGFEKYAIRKNYYTSPVENAILRVLHL